MKNILLVFGGKSYEHDISIITASQIFNRTRINDIELKLLYVSRENKFFIYDSKNINLKDFSINSNIIKNKKFKEVAFVSGENKKIFRKTIFGLKEYFESEFAIFCCHGANGENGKLVAFFEQFGIYSSAGNVDSLAVSMNKFLFKQTMKGMNIPVVGGFKISLNEFLNGKDRIEFLLRFYEFPLILKSNSGGSSIGMFIANSKDEFYLKLKDAFEFDDVVLVEKFINKTKEFNVAVLGYDENVQISDIDEPFKEHEILSFADKYLSKGNSKKIKISDNSLNSMKRNLPAKIDKKLEIKIKNYAKKIFLNLGFSGVVRIDFLLDEDSNKLYVCEVNSIPGSLAFYFFNNNKFLLNDQVLKLIDCAQNNKQKLNYFKEEFSTSLLE